MTTPAILPLALLAVVLRAAMAQPLPAIADKNALGPLSKVLIQYTTDGEVTLSLLNITFVTTELHVTLLGCDFGYFDNYALYPPVQSWVTEVTPFDCRECSCSAFDSVRTEPFEFLL